MFPGYIEIFVGVAVYALRNKASRIFSSHLSGGGGGDGGR